MRKLMLLAAMLALVAVVAIVPALARNNGFDDEFGFGGFGKNDRDELGFFESLGFDDFGAPGFDREEAVDEFCDEFGNFCEKEFGGDDFEDFSASRFGADDFDADDFDSNRFGANRFDANRFDASRFDGFDFDRFDGGGSGIVQQEIDQEAESGDFEAETEISLSGDNSNQCAPVLQFGNTGNNQNAQGLVQYRSRAEDVEFEGGSIVFAPEFENSCEQSVEQAAAAG